MADHTRILFIVKRRELPCDASNETSNYSNDSGYSNELSSGLLNSVRFVVKMLEEAGVDCHFAQVVDNNSISREVHAYEPTHVIIEALWVVPEKFEILRRLYPDVQWIVRLHSEIPFLANEGIAMDWIMRMVVQENVCVAVNSLYAQRDLANLLCSAHPEWSGYDLEEKLLYLPNFYPVDEIVNHRPRRVSPRAGILNVGCFGAIRPMKNTLMQAVAAIQYADSVGKTLHFWVNGNRNEQGGGNNLKNLQALFGSVRHELVEVPWLEHEHFLKTLIHMDLAMAVSFSETFCIVAADAVALGVPIVVSDEIEWASPWCRTDETDSYAIVRAMGRALHPVARKLAAKHSLYRLRNYCIQSRRTWLETFTDQEG